MNNDLYQIIITIFKNKKHLFSFDAVKEELILNNINIEDDEIGDTLSELEKDFVITHNKNNEFQLLSFFNLIYGKITLKQAGFGFIDNEELDLHTYVGKEHLKSALNGDMVIGNIFDLRKNEAEVTRIIKRSNDVFVGKIIYYRKRYYLKTAINIGPVDIIIKEENLHKAKVYDLVEVKPIKYFDNMTIFGEVSKIIGSSMDPYMDQLGIAIANKIDIEFDNDVLAEAKTIPQEVNINDYPKYHDYTNELIVTIDGADAKDFDDAISVKKLPNGNFELGVFIADVSNYVKNDSLMDLEAEKRGCSVYLINKVIPMLPFELSNGICSLNEGVNRLTLGCIMEINKDNGNIENYDTLPCIIKSHKRLTYNLVNQVLDQNNLFDDDLPLKEMLFNAYELANILKQKRLNRGSFFFETTEGYAKLDEYGHTVELGSIQRGISEGIIEEFMLCANETIAEIFRYMDYPFIYRVHEVPTDEKLQDLCLKINNLGFKLPKNRTLDTIKHAIQEIIKNNNPNEIGISDEVHNERLVINMELIRSMMKAKYQLINVGHFGLGSDAYTHFTSPIRRYPDLMVHRLLKEYILNMEDLSIKNPDIYYQNKLELICKLSNNAEKVAENIEREVLKYKQCEYMVHYISKVFYGTISSITSFGIFVTFDNQAEGLSRYQNMRHYIEYNEISNMAWDPILKKRYHIGMRVKIKLLDVSIDERKIDIDIL